MEMALGTVLGAGWASGVNLYGTVLLLGLFGRLDVAATPDEFQSPIVIGIAGALYLLEFVVDKIPFADSAWDLLHTAIRPIGAALVGALLADQADLSTTFAALSAGGMALGSHAAKAGTRVAVNTSPEPVTNVLVSLGEDGAVAGMVWFALEHPEAAGVLALVLLVLGIGMLILAWRLVRAGIRRFRGWRARRRAAIHLG